MSGFESSGDRTERGAGSAPAPTPPGADPTTGHNSEPDADLTVRQDGRGAVPADEMAAAEGAGTVAQPRPAAPSAPGETPTQMSSARDRTREQSLGAPRAVPGYVLLSEIGKGGFGEVWLAEDRFTGLKVAVKFFRRGAAGHWGDVVREGKVLADLDGDPGIVRYIEVQPEGDTPYYVMTYAEGRSLAVRLAGGRLPEQEALRIFLEAAQALAVVHVKGIRHCDLKPANLLFDGKGRVLLADFGQARISGESIGSLGTFFYMAPEQACESNLCPDSRWDVYALGAIAYEMLTGAAPHFDTELRQTIHQRRILPGGMSDALRLYRERLQQSPLPTGHRRIKGVGRDLAVVIDRCLAADPGARYEDAGDLLADLRRLESTRRRRPTQFAILGTALLATAALVAVAVVTAGHELREARRGLVDQTRRDNEYLADFVGKVLEMQILKDFGWIKRLAADPELSGAVGRGDAAAVEGFLRRAEKETSDHGFNGCTVADHHGRVIVATGRDRTSNSDAWNFSRGNPDHGYSFREWFNGLKQHPDESKTYPPLQKPRISRPYRSRGSDGKTPLDIGPALSAPLLDGGKVVGVIAAQIANERIYEWIGRVDLSIYPVLLADGCVVQSHRVFPNKVQHERDDPPLIRQPNSNNHPHGGDDGECNYCELIRHNSARSWSDEPFVDPVDRFVMNRSDEESTYTAGCKAMPELGWNVIIGRKHARVIEPLKVMRNGLIRWGIVGLSILLPIEFVALARMFRPDRSMERPRHD
jgi:serine/threonine protein kinase